ncbi:MAG: hypothetical protein XD66_0377 [Thermacetogenium phaeum]|uniref:Uncharacterized protein n=1 Tax=Thermacetogenium phaeum TaxID=85874 RepID=A0A101FH22_9THEO|nr:MAG: hypothetical protein XD66_0377 [Thermacetogenium phaeum]
MEWKLELEEFVFAGCMSNCSGMNSAAVEEPLEEE